jgi:hypothetical protein
MKKQENAREVSIITVVTSCPGVTLGGIVTSGSVVLGARRTNASLFDLTISSTGNWGEREGTDELDQRRNNRGLSDTFVAY